MLPTQVVPENKKSPEWAKANVNAIIRMTGSGLPDTKDRLCYDLYNGFQNEADFDYLTGTDEYRMPAKIRFMPITKPYFDLLKSTNESRRSTPKVYSIDTNSLNTKKDKLARMFVDKLFRKLDDSQFRLDTLKQQLQLKRQEMQAAAQEGQMDPSAQFGIGQMELQLAMIERAMQRGEGILEEEQRDLERVRRYSFSTHQEVSMAKGLEYLSRKYGWEDLFNQCFEDLMIIDNEIIKVEDIYEDQDPKIRRVYPPHFFYGATIDATWIDECPWTLEKRFMSVSQILDEYADVLSAEDREKLNKRYNYSGVSFGVGAFALGATNSFNAMPMGSTEACEPGSGIYSGSAMYTSDMIEVCVVCWKSSRKLNVKKSPNKYDPETEFTHLVSDEARAGKGERIERRYVSDWWTGTKIGGDIYVNLRKMGFQHRESGNLGKSYGPYIGYAYNGIDKRPYSRVWATKDISIMYNLVYYQMELLVALSGIKGVIMDKSQIPAGMEFEEWFYNFKQGVGLIDSQKVGPNGRVGTNFNQFQTYDLSFGQSIQQLDYLLQRLEGLAGRVIGIPPQRLGEVSQNDQVGTNKQAIVQSNLTTQTLFFKHQKFKRRVMDRVINAAAHAWKKGKRGQYVVGGLGQQVFELRAGDLDEAQFEIFYDDEGRNEEIMNRAMSAMENSFTQGQTPLSQLIESYQMTNLNQLQETVTYYEGIARKQFEQGREAEAISEQEKARMDAEMKTMLKKQLTDGEALKGQIAQAELELERARIGSEAQLRSSEISSKANTQIALGDQNTEVEYAYLKESARKTDMESRLRMLELQLQSNSAKSPISSPAPKNKTSDR